MRKDSRGRAVISVGGGGDSGTQGPSSVSWLRSTSKPLSVPPVERERGWSFVRGKHLASAQLARTQPQALPKCKGGWEMWPLNPEKDKELGYESLRHALYTKNHLDGRGCIS